MVSQELLWDMGLPWGYLPGFHQELCFLEPQLSILELRVIQALPLGLQWDKACGGFCRKLSED